MSKYKVISLLIWGYERYNKSIILKGRRSGHMKGTDVNKSKEGNGEILSKEESWRQVKVCVRNGNRNLYVCDADGLYCNHSNECGYEEIL